MARDDIYTYALGHEQSIAFSFWALSKSSFSSAVGWLSVKCAIDDGTKSTIGIKNVGQCVDG